MALVHSGSVQPCATKHNSDIQSTLFVHFMVVLANMYRQHLCGGQAEPLTWMHTLTNATNEQIALTNSVCTHMQTHSLYVWHLSLQTKPTYHLFFFPKDSTFLTFPQTFLFAGVGGGARGGLSSQTGIDPELPPWTGAPRAAQCKHTAAPLHLVRSRLHSLLHCSHIYTHTTNLLSHCCPSPPGRWRLWRNH